MKVVVTGCAGLIGSHLAHKLQADGHKVLGIDDFSGGTKENIIGLRNFINLDVRKCKKLTKAFKEFAPDIVHHLSAHPHEGLSQFCPEKITSNTYNASLSVFKASINCGTLPKIIYYSSMARYGNGGMKLPFTEDMRMEPEDIYAIAKCSAERALEILSFIHKFDYNIVVPHNIFGPRVSLHDPYRNVLALWCNAILRGKPVVIFGDGEQRRAPSYVDDILDPIIKLGFDENINKEIVNMGSEHHYTIKELAQMVINEFGLKLEPMYVSERPCEVKNAYCSVGKSVKLLGFKDNTGIIEGIHKLAMWAKEVGPKEPVYLEELEIEDYAPEVWTKKILK